MSPVHPSRMSFKLICCGGLELRGKPQRARGFVCAGRQLGMLLLPTLAALPSELFREHLFLSQALALHCFPLYFLGKSPEKSNRIVFSKLSIPIEKFCPLWAFQISSSIHGQDHWSPSVISLDSLCIHSYPLFYYLLSWHGK